MGADEQVVTLLKFALTIGPIAVYFLALGLLNAQSRPQLITGRADFSLLAVVFFPILVWVLLLVVNLGWIVLAIVAFAAGLGFYWMMPRRQTSWVVYNVGERQFSRALVRALERLGLASEPMPADPPGHPVLHVPALGLRVRLSPFPLLRNVTCRFERTDGQPIEPADLASLLAGLRDELETTSAMPTASAACFLLIGTVMLSAPLLLMARHMDEIVRVVRNLLA
ncbi:MAG: hypothetical protein BIFFINMI_03421 [Phycisphaerae bacterium]|nr:hypothetical protein [Phycisphaerae bacterium]